MLRRPAGGGTVSAEKKILGSSLGPLGQVVVAKKICPSLRSAKIVRVLVMRLTYFRIAKETIRMLGFDAWKGPGD